ncbi:hypothetical protein Dsin_008767 [Dipteronia sinensis]|uniref:Cytochrome c oxidase subunit n=1 Tax=Dipteronia sinensis TaxID=43782 RepID=A0AAE0AQJ4_9ROSI|nr:hypothetical protein Dsin_008767 [Dipteronia sinensis]
MADEPQLLLETAPADFRFPTTNQTRHCFTRYIEFHRCLAVKGEESNACETFAKYYRALCPGEWMIKRPGALSRLGKAYFWRHAPALWCQLLHRRV